MTNVRLSGFVAACATAPLLLGTGRARAADAGTPADGGAALWVQQAMLMPGTPAQFQLFGDSVAVDGTMALVGAPGQATAGAVYAFTRSGASWSLQGELTASDGTGGENVGSSVALSGSLAVVGTFGGSAAYVFAWNGTQWTQQAKLTPTGYVTPNTYGLFGTSVAISGTTAFVGAPDLTVGTHELQGGVYVFTQSGTTWTQQAELTVASGAAGDTLGYSLAVDGTTLVVGAPCDTGLHGSGGQGSAYVFTQSGTTWTQQAALTAGDGATGDRFGCSMSLSGTSALIGSAGATIGNNTSQGAAYLFDQSGGGWTQDAKLTAVDGAMGDAFGNAVSLSAGTALVGAWYQGSDVMDAPNVGAAYVFVPSATGWTEQAELTPSDPYYDLGCSVALSGTTAVVGECVDGSNGAWVFDRAVPDAGADRDAGDASASESADAAMTDVSVPVDAPAEATPNDAWVESGPRGLDSGESGTAAPDASAESGTQIPDSSADGTLLADAASTATGPGDAPYGDAELADDQASPPADATPDDAATNEGRTSASAGCGCHAAGTSERGLPLFAATAIAAIALSRRRRRAPS
jgi:MYXO-CTERM domain-containing protein